MRWVVVALLIANLLLFGWYRYLIAPGGIAVAPGVENPEGDSLQVLGGEAEAVGTVSVTPDIDARGAGTASLDRSPALCEMIGAFTEQISARQVRDRLLALGATAEIVEVPITSRVDYWVHTGPYPSRDQAMVALRELQQRGIDSFLIAGGELANGISLGLFRQKASADALLAERRAQGFDASLREVPRINSELWVVIKEGHDLTEPIRNQLLAVSPGTELRKNPCDSIVSVDKFE